MASSTSESSSSAKTAAAKVFTLQEVSAHNRADDLWIAVNGFVYDLTKFVKLHPGGKAVLTAVAGTDATKQFYALHNKTILAKYKRLRIGTLKEAEGKSEDEVIPDEEPLVSQVPYSEPMFLRDGWAKSPYMNDSHEAFCKGIRAFINEDLLPDTAEAEVSGEYPTKEIYQKMGQAGLLAARIGPACMPVVKKLGIKLPGGVSPDDFDYFHEMLAHEAIGRLYKVSPGYVDGLGAGFCIGLPPVLYFAKKELQKQVVPEVLLGNKRICLAISEPIAGSDVANIETTAKKSECGKYYILNGVKKWITNGMFADYFVTAVRTGGKGMKGISMICVPREGAGGTVTTKPIPTSYSPAAGTALVMFDDFKVPVECLLDKEGGGFKVIMANFNHERWWICAAMTGCMRECVKDCQLWSSQREVFGKKLIKEPVIRQKLAKLMVAVESQGAHIESLTHQMKEMDYFTQAMKLAGPIALLKFNTTRLLTMMSDEAVQIFGGRGITRGGMGAGVEKLQKTFKFSSILGGSEEIMADLGVRQAMREMPQSARL